MPNTYTTITGDTWDKIAYKVCENEMQTDKLIKKNLDYKDTIVFSAGIVIQIPEIDLEVSDTLPPWKTGGGDE